jgi:hypothetical protein
MIIAPMTSLLVSWALGKSPDAARLDFGCTEDNAPMSSRGVHVNLPPGWKCSNHGGQLFFDSPQKDAQLRIYTFEKERYTDAQTCLDKLVDHLAHGEQKEKASYSTASAGRQPAVTQVKLIEENKRQRQRRRLVGCNGLNYVIVDLVEAVEAGSRYENLFTQTVASISFDQPTVTKSRDDSDLNFEEDPPQTTSAR